MGWSGEKKGLGNMNTDITINLKANVDEATQNIAVAGQSISSSLRGVEDSGRDLTSSLNASVPALSATEQEQLADAAIVLRLRDAEGELKAANDNLNSTIRTCGVDSGKTAEALRDLNAAQDNVKTLQAQVGQSTERGAASMRGFALGASGAATAMFSFYGAIDRVQQAELSRDRANLQVKSSTNAVEDAERRLGDIRRDSPGDSEKIAAAEDDLTLARERLSLANERAQQTQENVSQAIMSSALQVIPTSITMVDNLSKAWKNFPDLTDAFGKLKTKIGDVGDSVDGLGAKLKGLNGISFGTLMGGLAAVAVAAADIKYSVDQTGKEKQVYKAEHGTEMPWYEQAWGYLKNFEIGAPMMIADNILANLGVQKPTVEQEALMNKRVKGEISDEEFKAAWDNLPHLAEGGVLTIPTVVVAGEAGPEIYMPLAKYEAQRASDRQTPAAAAVPQQVFVDLGGMHFYGDIADSKFLEKSAEFTADKISDAVNLRRGT